MDVYVNFCDYILYIVSNALGKEVRELHLDSPISQLGLDSMAIIKIISSINKAFKLELSPVTLYGHKTIRDITSDLYNRFGDKINISIPEINYPQQTQRDYLLVFSAFNKELLLNTLRNIAYYLKDNINDHSLIANLEKKLMSTCKPEKERLAIIARDNVSLLREINHFISGQLNEQIYIGEMRDNSHNITIFAACDKAKMFIKNHLLRGEVKKLAVLWSLGIEMDWSGCIT
ncbi:MAG: hypothetical protein EPO11_10865 [Gammaproteobacteria bacterium]|nr:MAG: hypothetical protein EPO11_10865 [Gammaproteobacteria bacterium]